MCDERENDLLIFEPPKPAHQLGFSSHLAQTTTFIPRRIPAHPILHTDGKAKFFASASALEARNVNCTSDTKKQAAGGGRKDNEAAQRAPFHNKERNPGSTNSRI